MHLFTEVRGRSILGSPDAEFCIDLPQKAARMPS
jgi:hypothetical protein